MISSSLGAAHLTAALVALLFGFVVLAAPKGTQPHRLFGAGYVSAMVVANLSALGMFRLTGAFNAFHGLALLSLLTIVWGLFVAMRRRKGWMSSHLYCMSYSYLGLLAAAASELVLRIAPLRAVARDGAGIVTAGVMIALAFVLIGTLIVPRLGRAMLTDVADR